MVAFSPAPSMIVVVSFRSARAWREPSIDGDVLEFDAEILEIIWPAVSTAMSSSIALRRSPKPTLTAATLRPPRSF